MLPILMYHSVDDSGSILSVAPHCFEQQMAWLHSVGGCALTLEAASTRLAAGLPLPERAFVLTFDDGFESVYRNAFPILQRYAFTATVFLVANHIGRRNDWTGQPAAVSRQPLMNWTQIRALQTAGIEFGSHTCSHARLDLLEAEQAKKELAGSKATLEDGLGKPVTTFAYPYGRSSAAVQAWAAACYQAACSTRLGLAGPGSPQHYLPRVDVATLPTSHIFEGLFSAWMPAYLEARRCVRLVAGSLFHRAWV